MYGGLVRTLCIALAVSFLLLMGVIAYAGRFDDPPEFRTFIDRSGELIGTLDPRHRGVSIWTPIFDIPDRIKEKTIASEDRHFYLHRGINPFSILRAALENLREGRIVRGGSTITQQLAKNLIEGREGRVSPRTIRAKIEEAAVAVGLELKHGKGWILERYLNTAYYGRRAYGIAAAADVRLSKRLEELTEEEIDFLVLLPKAPNRLASKSFVSSGGDDSHNLASDGLGGTAKSRPAVGRHFIEFARSQIARGDSRLRIDTTLDLYLQGMVEDAIGSALEFRVEEDPRITAAAVVVDVRSGDILAMAGSRDYFDEESGGAVNAAVAPRQPGSALKPFTYFAAFARGFGPDSIVPDEPLSFSAAGLEEGYAYSPQNFDRRYHGDITIRKALANSYNVPAVVTLNEIGLSFFHELLKRFGFTTLVRPPPHYGLAVTLGSGEVTLLELTNAYAALARGGEYLPYRCESGGGGAIPVPVLPGAVRQAADVTSILSDPDARMKAFGANDSMVIEGHRVAIKTGTSYEHRDNWAVGYSPSFAVGVWVGHADGSPLDDASMTGASSAAPIWHSIMELLLRGRPAEEFPFIEDDSFPMPPVRKVETKLLKEDFKSFALISPVPNSTYRIHKYMPAEHQGIEAGARVLTGEELSISWYLNDEYIGTTLDAKPRIVIGPSPGKHRIRAISSEGEEQEAAFRVIEDDSSCSASM